MSKDNEKQIRELVDSWADAVSRKDVDAIMAHYSEDVSVYDVPTPLQDKGRDNYRKHWEGWLEIFDGPTVVEFKDMQVTAGEDVAFVNTLTKVSEKADPDKGSWVRVTVGYKKIDGKWTATHEHVSIPAGD